MSPFKGWQKRSGKCVRSSDFEIEFFPISGFGIRIGDGHFLPREPHLPAVHRLAPILYIILAILCSPVNQ